jgi:transcriptional regulator with XRE-family HTH domain
MRVDTSELKRRRMEAGLSLRGLAAAAGVSHDTAMEIESGRREPHPATVKKLADALNINIGTLVDWEAEGLEEGKAAA